MVRFWVPRLIDQVRGIGAAKTCCGHLPPGQAAKFYGCLNFLLTGCWGKVFRSGLNDIKHCQHNVRAARDLAGTFTMIEHILDLRFERNYMVSARRQPRLRFWLGPLLFVCSCRGNGPFAPFGLIQD